MPIEELHYRAKRVFHFFKTGLGKGLRAQIKYGFPARKLTILAVTGTDGKTTSATMLYQVLKAAGKKVALLSTVAAYIGSEELDTGFHVTTPDADELQRFLAKMVKADIEYVVMEATSHGIYQYRTWGVKPKIVGYTNITREHLDYHKTYELYLEAKALLGQQAETVILNADDELSFSKLKKILDDHQRKILTYSHTDSIPVKVRQAITRQFPEAYNQLNARLVYAFAKELEIDNKFFVTAMDEFQNVPGRMQTVIKTPQLEVIVDFAHTPTPLQAALTATRQRMNAHRKKGRLIAVFGCASKRDVSKRPVMGRIGAELADLAVFTAEDPRMEDVWSIFRQMKSELGPFHAKVLTIPDRRQAIEFTLQELIQPGDVVMLLGKGHEKSICYGTTEYPWSDSLVAQEALKGQPKKES